MELEHAKKIEAVKLYEAEQRRVVVLEHERDKARHECAQLDQRVRELELLLRSRGALSLALV